MTKLKKAMVVNLLGYRFGLRNYMELATCDTGHFYCDIDRKFFDQLTRMLYVTPIDFDDGMTIDFRSPDEDIAGLLQDFRQSGLKLDICLLDSWHLYHTSYRDLSQIFDLLNDGGVMVVHDCLPLTREGTTPQWQPGSWWGTSYKAYLDFVLQTPSLDYFTIDSDHGCGVIIKNRSFETALGPDAPQGWLPVRPAEDLVTKWRAIASDYDLAYTVFEEHRAALLRLIPADRFVMTFATQNLGSDHSASGLLKALAKKSATYRRPHYYRFLFQHLWQRLAVLTGR